MTTTGETGGHGGPLDELRIRLITELRERLIEQAVALPLGNQPALIRVTELCRTEDATPQAIAAEASLDEGFAAVLLRVANSAALGGSTHVDDLPGAVTRLGVRFVESLAIAAPCLRLLAAPSDGLEQARAELHRHGVRTGALAHVLAPAGIDPDRALAAGLVHNLGLSILALHARSGFRKLLDAAAAGEQFALAETRLFGFTHAELGATLAEEWSFPESIVEVVREHDADRPVSQLAALVQLSDRLVRRAGFGIEPPVEPSPDVADRAGVDLSEAHARAASLFHAGAPSGGGGENELLVSVLETIA